MNKHTKGPWTKKDTLFGEWEIGSEYTTKGHKLANGRQLIAYSPRASSKLNPDYFEMFQANAKLITASPDLLEALKDCVDYGMEDWVIVKAKAALAKVTEKW